MGPLRLLIALTLVPAAFGRRSLITSAKTPVETVINLLQGLKQKVQMEGELEAGTYDEFACFCKKTTKAKSKSIQKGANNIDALSSSISQKTAIKEDKIMKLKESKKKHEEMQAELAETKQRCAAEKAQYEATNADLGAGIYGLEKAKKSLESAKPASFIELREAVKRGTGLDDPDIQATGALLQQQAAVDPSDPDYKYQSQGIIDTIEKLHKMFTKKQDEVNKEWAKTRKTCKSTKKSLREKLKKNAMKMKSLTKLIEKTKAKIAKNRESLLNNEDQLKDDQQYMKDLTSRCEVRAKEYDQRSTLRNDELEAFTKALALLEKKVKDMDKAANKRAFLESGKSKPPTEAQEGLIQQPEKEDDDDSDPESFLQTSSITAGTAGTASTATTETTAAMKEEVVALLRSTASKSGSSTLALLAEHVAANPFIKVKGLIQKLIERLLEEANSESTKKGFCDTELAKARQARDYRLDEAKDLNAQISGLEAEHDELVAEMSELKAAIKQAQKDLTTTAELRKKEKEENLLTIKNAKAGLEALTEAIAILRNFFTKAARARVLLQASPVDEDTKGAGFSGAYQGAQENMQGIFGMLEVIKTDFERTIRKTTAAEEQAHEEFVDFERTSLSDISGKQTKHDLDKQDLKTNKATTKSKMADLQTATDLVDSNLKAIEGLKPTCIDTGMSYEDRVAKREEEIKALEKALKILAPK